MELDAGTMRFDSPTHLHEAGVDGSYEEEWVRLVAAPVVGVRLVPEAPQPDGPGPEVAYLLEGDGWAAWGVGRAGGRFPGPSWNEFALAKRATSGSWNVVASTSPWREGEAALLELPAGPLDAPRWRAGDVLEVKLGDRSRWRVTEA